MTAPYTKTKIILAGISAPATLIPVTNPLERLNKEVKRRADVVGILRGQHYRLISAVLLEQNDKYQHHNDICRSRAWSP
jgi:transposase-like protein